MDSTAHVSLSRQRDLLRELSLIANNMANLSTVGFQREELIFSEFVKGDRSDNSMSIGRAGARYFDSLRGPSIDTGNDLDLAIEGEGYFLVETSGGPRLTRAGAFLRSPEGEMVDASGNRVLGEGGAPIALPASVGQFAISGDGTISADGVAIDKVGVVEAEWATLVREGNGLFDATEGFRPAEAPRVRQGFLEGSNVNPVLEISRLIAVQRAYEQSHALLAGENERITDLVNKLGQNTL